MNSFSKEQFEKLNSILLDIHSTENLEEMCRRVMAVLPSVIPHEKSFFSYVVNNRENAGIRSLTMTDEELDAYLNRYCEADYTAWYRNQKDVKVYRDSDLVNEGFLDHSEIYQSWVIPMGMRYVCGNVVKDGETTYADLTLLRSEEHGDYTDQEMFLLSLITDHMLLWFKKNYVAADLTPYDNKKDLLKLLTPRETEVASLACSRLKIREIAVRLSVSYSTVRQHMASIYVKLGVNSRVELINLLK